MKELNIETGVKEYSINGDYIIRFNPTDPNFISKLSGCLHELQAANESYANIDEKENLFAAMEEADEKMREILDDTFGESFCASVFKSCNLNAFSGGLPLWCLFIFSLMDEIDGEFNSVEFWEKNGNKKIDKYLKKYKHDKVMK